MHEVFNMVLLARIARPGDAAVKVRIRSQDELEAFLEDCGDKIVVIDFWAGWCGPCKIVGPVFERLARDQAVSAKLVFVKVDVDEAPDIAEWIGIECMPMFCFYKNGEKIDEFAGANGKLLEEKIRHYAQNS